LLLQQGLIPTTWAVTPAQTSVTRKLFRNDYNEELPASWYGLILTSAPRA
jgi:hypothetical protein